MSSSTAKPRTWTLTSGHDVTTCKSCGKKHRGKEPVVIAVGPLPKNSERILVEEKDNNYVGRD